MYKRAVCKHLQDADRLEIIEIRRITDDYIYYWCPICRRMGKVANPSYLNKWEYWKLLQLLNDAFENANSTSKRCFIENMKKICEHLYDQVPVSTIKFSSIVENVVTNIENA